jgi:death-on-curing protein
VTPTFLTLDEVLALHAEHLRRFGGAAGLRDANLLASALGAPQASFGGEFLHFTLPEMAAAYLFHLAKNHPFVDGNKRTALAAAMVFLRLHDLRVEASDDALYRLVMAVAEGRRTKAEAAAFLNEHARKAGH